MIYRKGFKKDYVYIMVEDVASQQQTEREEAYVVPTLGSLIRQQEEQNSPPPEQIPQIDKPYTPPSLSDVIKNGDKND